MYSKPVYGTRTSGISIDPSAFCPFSIIATQILGRAKPDPFKV